MLGLLQACDHQSTAIWKWERFLPGNKQCAWPVRWPSILMGRDLLCDISWQASVGCATSSGAQCWRLDSVCTADMCVWWPGQQPNVSEAGALLLSTLGRQAGGVPRQQQHPCCDAGAWSPAGPCALVPSKIW